MLVIKYFQGTPARLCIIIPNFIVHILSAERSMGGATVTECQR